MYVKQKVLPLHSSIANAMTKSIQTRDLKPGMEMAYTHDIVQTHPYSGLSTKRGKLDFIVKTPKGHMVQKSWNRHTFIAIIQN